MRHLLTLLIAIPALAPIGLWLVPRRLVRAQQAYAFVVALLVFGLSLLLLRQSPLDAHGFLARFNERADWVPSAGIAYSVGVDGISIFLVLLTTLLTPIALLSSFRAVTERVREYLASFLLLEAAMLGAFVALDMFLFFLFWEVMLVPMFVIIGVWGGPRRVYAAVKFFLFTMVGSALMLVAILYLAWQHSVVHGFWSFDYFALRDLLLPYRTEMLLFAAFTLSFAIKVPMFPLHTWLPDAHVEAPTAGSVILAAILLKMGTYGFLRFSMGLFPYASFRAGPTIAVLAVVGILYGALVAWKQTDVKKLVAYSSVSHLGFVMLGLAAAEPRAMAGAILQMINHGISTGALFLLVGVIYERRHTRRMEEFGGLATVMPMYAALFLVVTLSSIGLPGTNGFVGEFYVLLGSFQSEVLPRAHWLVMAAALGVVLGAVYMLGMYLKVFFGPVRNPKNEGLRDVTAREILCFAPLVLLIFGIGLLPGWLTRRMEHSVRVACADYVDRVIEMDDLRRAGGLDETQSRRLRTGRLAEAIEAGQAIGLIGPDGAGQPVPAAEAAGEPAPAPGAPPRPIVNVDKISQGLRPVGAPGAGAGSPTPTPTNAAPRPGSGQAPRPGSGQGGAP
ncbi:MAG: NADH-quinone oxidoreductase subunit M [Deltaproteobacteria bacterium]|nr:NADH-quinone oxidoreductase subunit M [Deltaproteobacteria bacterium]